MPRKNEPTSRMCIVTRNVRPVDELVRFVIAPDGTVVPDLKGRLPGRGVWVTATADAIDLAERRRLFARGFHETVSVAPGLAERTDARMLAGLVGALGLARKAGTIVTGFGKVEAALASGKAIGIIHASDAADDGIKKLESAARRSGLAALPVIRLLSSDQLDLALGGANVIHAALLAGGPSEAVLERASALARFRGIESPPDGKDPSESAANASAGHRSS
jgi:predicted RNA-binding protein YlxR (DUF448 family)